MKKTKSRNRKVKILQGNGKIRGQGGSRINAFTDSFGGVEHYKSKSLDRRKPKK